MIYKGSKEVSAIYYGKKVVSVVYKGLREVWSSITSAWINDKPWNNNQGWKNE